MSILETYIKTKLAGSVYKDFEVIFSVGFCQSDYVNIYGSWEESEFKSAIVEKGVNPVLQGYISRLLSEVEVHVGCDRRFMGGSNEYMSFTELTSCELESMWDEAVDKNDQEDLIPLRLFGVVAEIIADSHDEFVQNVKRFCHDTLSECHDIALNMPYEKVELFSRTIGGATVTAWQVPHEDFGDDFFGDLEVELSFFEPLLKHEAKIVDLMVEVSYKGGSESYYSSFCYGQDAYILSEAKILAREAISNFREVFSNTWPVAA